jgi:2-phospho-L-lactate guanylyltransferase
LNKIFALVPVKRFENSKSRLRLLLSKQLRIRLAELLLVDTISVLMKSSTLDTIVIVSGDDRARSISDRMGVTFLRQDIDNGVDQAVSAGDDFSNKNGADATIVIPHDLPLLLPTQVDMICRLTKNYQKCMVISPSLRHDGSNILLRKPINLIRTHYDDDSYTRHIEEALAVKAAVIVVLSDRTTLDMDTGRDVELLLARYGPIDGAALNFVRKNLGHVVNNDVRSIV